MQTLTIAENNNAELKKKLADEEHACRSANSALDGVQSQAEDQRKRLRETTNQLTAAREQMAALKKKRKKPKGLKIRLTSPRLKLRRQGLRPTRLRTRLSKRVTTLE